MIKVVALIMFVSFMLPAASNADAEYNRRYTIACEAESDLAGIFMEARQDGLHMNDIAKVLNTNLPTHNVSLGLLKQAYEFPRFTEASAQEMAVRYFILKTFHSCMERK